MNVATRTIDEFLRLQRTLAIETREFRDLRHNDDLCPRLQGKLEAVLRATGRFEPIVYDTQGFMDHGIDVVIRVRDQRRSDDEPPELLGFQVKSYHDFKGRDFFQNLKAQRDDAFRKCHGLSSYYILLCTDEHEHKDKIRGIEAEFKAADRTFVIEPTFAQGFLRLSDRRIEGTITRIQHAHDIVFRRALATVSDLGSATAALLALYLAARHLDMRSAQTAASLRNQRVLEEQYSSVLVARRRLSDQYEEKDAEEDDPKLKRERIRTKEGPTESDLKRMSETFFDTFEEALGYDLDLLDNHLISVDSSSGRVAPRPHEMLPLVALLTDAQVRYDLEDDQLFIYGAEALGLMD